MGFPDTIDQVIARHLDRIEAGAKELALPPTHFEEDDEHRQFRLAAQAGAQAYAEELRSRVANEKLDYLDVEMADLVATSAECAGWIGATGAVTGRNAARDALEEQGYLVFQPAVPGEWVACYRLMAPC